MNITEFTNTLRKVDRTLNQACSSNSEKARLMQTLMQQYATEELSRREAENSMGPDMPPVNRMDEIVD